MENCTTQNPALSVLFGDCLKGRLSCGMMSFGSKDKRGGKTKRHSLCSVQLTENTVINPESSQQAGLRSCAFETC